MRVLHGKIKDKHKVCNRNREIQVNLYEVLTWKDRRYLI